MVDFGMACVAKRNQVLIGIIPCLAAELFVMDFEIGHGSA